MSITKRANGKYTAQVQDPATGKRRSLGTYDRRQDAKNAVEDALERRDHNEPLVPELTYTMGSMPLEVFVRDHFLTSNKLRASEGTRENYKVDTNRLLDFFGKDRPLNSIKNDDVLDFMEWFQFVRDDKGEVVLNAATGEKITRSKNYQRKVAQRLRQIYTVAVKCKFIRPEAHPYKSGAENDELPTRPTGALRIALSHEAAITILKTLGALSSDPERDEVLRMEAEYWHNLLGTALHTGMRMSELCGLRVADLDEATQTVQVEHQWGWNINAQSEELRFPPPKSKTSRRAIPMTETTFRSLWNWAIVMRQNGSPDDLVFPRPMPLRRAVIDGWGLWGSPSNFTKHYRSMLKQVWIEYDQRCEETPVAKPLRENEIVVNIHMWRHLFCVVCLTNGIDVNTVSNWMGHHSAAFTYETYSRYVPSRIPLNLAKLDKAWSPEAQVELF